MQKLPCSFTDELVNSTVDKLRSDSPSVKSSSNLIRVTNKIINKIAINHHLFGRLVPLLANHKRLKIYKEPVSQTQGFTAFLKTTTLLLTAASTGSWWRVCGCSIDPMIKVSLDEV